MLPFLFNFELNNLPIKPSLQRHWGLRTDARNTRLISDSFFNEILLFLQSLFSCRKKGTFSPNYGKGLPNEGCYQLSAVPTYGTYNCLFWASLCPSPGKYLPIKAWIEINILTFFSILFWKIELSDFCVGIALRCLVVLALLVTTSDTMEIPLFEILSSALISLSDRSDIFKFNKHLLVVQQLRQIDWSTFNLVTVYVFIFD